ncbi:MAG: hypothetical protein CMG66_05045 [Candidatus Marinimicrobia bacterium]|nr:hypothetical protein [Candidatus Neomarinimicrobiota bacterium]|tara:strand:- start:4067 stop:5923 length:1857 start_codon:yes stop_codon:yes gene_type:complete
MFKQKIYIYLFFIQLLIAGFLPLDNSSINYTQVFFKWPQINGAQFYTLSIEDDSSENFQINTISNSVIVDSFLNWNNSYNWTVCGIDEINNYPLCYETFSLSINSLPSYYPNNIEVIFSSDLYSPGITLLDFDSMGFSAAINKQGYPVWFVDKSLFGQFNSKILVTQLLKSGNFVGLGLGKGYEFDINGNIDFVTPAEYDIHHHFIKLDSTYLLIDGHIESHPCPSPCPDNLPEDILWLGDRYVEIDLDGNLIWDWNTFDYISLDDYNPLYLQRLSNNYEAGDYLDWTHSNSLFYDDNNQTVFISIRNLSRIINIDYNSRNIIWQVSGDNDLMANSYFDNDIVFSQQHSVQKNSNDRIIFFDNHSYLDPEISKCIEFEYNSDSLNIVWDYTLPNDLFTGSRGECERLENGNTLINVGRTGNLLEVDNNSDLIWHLSMKNDNSEVASFRSSRIDNLYPLAYSFIINDLQGFYNEQNYYYNDLNDDFEFTIYNIGWSKQIYDFMILDFESNLLYSDSILINANDSQLIEIDLSEISIVPNQLVHFKIIPVENPNLYQEIYFSIINYNLGDVNYDGIINVLDVILMVNSIIDGNNNNSFDLNLDGVNDILDIVLLINIILN